MTGTVNKLEAALLAGLLVALATWQAASAHSIKPSQQQRQDQPAKVQQEPQKRQNFRARRPGEFPPWEGFEDCPMAFPCVGMIQPFHRRN